MSEKYNVPEPNSLDSMKGVENNEVNKRPESESVKIGSRFPLPPDLQAIRDADLELKDFNFSDLEKEEAFKTLQSLGQEQLDRIKEKIQDIYTVGTAYTAISPNSVSEIGASLYKRLERVLKMGILNKNWLRDIYSKEGRIGYHSDITEGEIFFNIVGKSANFSHKEQKYQLQKGFAYVDNTEFNVGALAIIFDIDKYKSTIEDEYRQFKESPESFIENYKGQSGKLRKSRSYTYQTVNPFKNILNDRMPFTEEGLPMVDSEYGYSLSHRIPTKFFKGLVLRLPDNEPKKFFENVLTTIGLNLKNDYLVPIYDTDGNLLWPEVMSHEEIVKMKGKPEQK